MACRDIENGVYMIAADQLASRRPSTPLDAPRRLSTPLDASHVRSLVVLQVTYLCGDCGADTQIKQGDVIRCVAGTCLLRMDGTPGRTLT
jgi:hypothetical protein